MPSLLRKESIPNLLTGLRFLLIPVLWVLALRGMDVWVGMGVLLAWFTDALDGFLARRWKATTPFGSRFDSLTDGLVFASAIGWLVILRPEFVREHATILLIWLAIGVANYLLAWIRFRRFADVHLYSAKAANFVGFIFAAYLLIFDSYPLVFFYLTMTVLLVASVETFLALLTQNRVDEHMVTILRPLRRRQRRGRHGVRRREEVGS